MDPTLEPESGMDSAPQSYEPDLQDPDPDFSSDDFAEFLDAEDEEEEPEEDDPSDFTDDEDEDEYEYEEVPDGDVAGTGDPWQGLAERLKTVAEAAGFRSPEEFQAAQQAMATAQLAEQQWEQNTTNSITAELQSRIEARLAEGKITLEEAAAEFDEQFDARMITAYHARAQEQFATQQVEQQMTQNIDLERRSVSLAYAEAAKANPLLDAGDGFGRDLVEALAVSGLAGYSDTLPRFTQFANAIAERAVAHHVATEAAKQNEPFILSPGSQAPASDNTQAPSRMFDWTHDLFRRDGIK